MATPIIQSTGSTSGAGVAGQGRNDLVISETVGLSDTEPLNVGASYVWVFEDIPIGSSTTMVNATTATPSFVPDITGSYRVRCTVDGTDISVEVFAVPLPVSGGRIPSFEEELEYDEAGNAKGWHYSMSNWMRSIDDKIGSAGTFTYRLGSGATGPGVFGAWTDLYAALVAARSTAGGDARFTIVFDDTATTPLTIGSGAYDMSNVKWKGRRRPGATTGIPVITIQEGATFTGLFEFEDVEVNYQSTATSPITVSGFAEHFSFINTEINSTGAAAVPFINATSATSPVILELYDSNFGRISAVTPIFDLGASGQFTNLELYGTSYVGSSVFAGTGTATIYILPKSLYASYSKNQPSFAGSYTISVPDYADRLHFAPAVGTAAYTTNQTNLGSNGVSFYRGDASGGAVQFTLKQLLSTDAVTTEGRTVVVKEVSGTAGLTVAPGSGDTIDGSASAISVPPGGSVRLVSDGVTGWYTIGGDYSTSRVSPTILTYRQGASSTGPGVYSTWASLMTALTNARAVMGTGARFQILFDETDTSPLTIPSGGPYNMTNVEWVGKMTNTNVTPLVDVQEGATFTNLFEFRAVQVGNRATATSPMTLSNLDAIELRDGADISGLGANAVPFFNGTGLSASDIVLLNLRGGAFGNRGQAYETLELAASTSAIINIESDGILGKNTVAGPASSTILLGLNGANALYGPQNSFTGTWSDWADSPFGPRWRFDPAVGAAALVGATTVEHRDGVVRANATAGSFQLTLRAMPGSSFNNVGQPIFIKEVSGVNSITVAPGGANTIDGSASAITVPAGGSALLMPDGVSNWLLLGEYGAAAGGGVTALSVTNIDDPSTELNAISGSAKGDLRLCYQTVAGTDQWTLYAWDDADSNPETVPLTVDGSTGKWSAIAGKYNSNSVLTADGAVGSPAFSFGQDSDSGLYRIGANNIGIATGGTLAVSFNSAQQTLHDPGSAATPAIAANTDTNTGGFWLGGDVFGISTGGVEAIRWNASQQTLLPDGTVSAPALAFANYTGHGAYATSATTWELTAAGLGILRLINLGGGDERLNILANEFTPSAAWGANCGTSGKPFDNFWGRTFNQARASVGTGETVGILSYNYTAAAAGAQQYSPMFVMQGEGWETAVGSSQEVGFAWQVQPVQGTANPTGELVLKSRIENVSAGAYTDHTRFHWDGANKQILAPPGSETRPGYSFIGNTGDGMFRGASEMSFSFGGTDYLRLLTGYVLSAVTHRFQSGTVSAPGIAFQADTGFNTGFYWVSQGVMAATTDGIEAMRWNASQQTLVPDGSPSAPSYSFANATNTGMYLDTASLEFAVAGTQYVSMSSSAVRVNGAMLPEAEHTWDLGSATRHWEHAYLGHAFIAPEANTTGAQNDILYTAPAHTGLTASTEVSSVLFDMSATKTWASGALATQRAFRVVAPTYDIGANTLTTAATMYISGAPAAGGSTTITNAYALWVDAGVTRLDGDVTANADVTLTNGDLDAAGGFRRTLQTQWLNNPSTSTTYTMTLDGTLSGADHKGWFVMPRNGSVVELSAWVDADVAAGQIDFWIESSTDGGTTWGNEWGSVGSPIFSLDSATNPEFNSAAQAKDTSTVNAGNMLRIRAATNGTFSSGRFVYAAIGVEC